MFLLNLSLPEFLAIAGALSGLITVLYFFDRSKRKKTVSTLRFWTGAQGAEQQKRRKSVRQPWSLLLQLLSILLLLLAIARLQWGSRHPETRNTVLLLDTSSAASGKTAGGTVLAREKALARQYLSRLGASDRAMLVRVDALASPATPFTTDRQELRRAIDDSTAGYAALHIERALNYARQAANRASGAIGEIVYIGPEKIAEPFSAAIPGLRILRAQADAENCGIRGIAVSRAEGEDAWRAAVTVRNDGTRSRALQLSARFGTTSFALRRVTLGPGAESAVSYQFIANSAGQFNVRLQPGDSLAADDEASVALPASRPAQVFVYSERQDAWHPLLAADRSLNVKYEAVQKYDPGVDADVVILDRFAPASRPRVASLWVDVPAEGSPLPVKSDTSAQLVTQWNADGELGAGLHARDILLPKAKAFQTFDKDFVVASTAKGPVAVVRPAGDAGGKIAVVGFDFAGEPLRYKITSPILFANLMRWLAPQAFRAIEVSAEPVGLADVMLDNGEQAGDVRVTGGSGRAVPFLLQGGRLQFFVESPAVVHVVTRQRERVLSMVLPEIAIHDWKVPSTVSQGLPGFSAGAAAAIDLWQVLACLGGLGLLLEWFLFGSERSFRRPARAVRPVSSASERERELVGK